MGFLAGSEIWERVQDHVLDLHSSHECCLTALRCERESVLSRLYMITNDNDDYNQVLCWRISCVIFD